MFDTYKSLKKSLNEKEVLIKEIHHRVKNNLQLISSLLFLKLRKVKDPESKQVYRDLALLLGQIYELGQVNNHQCRR